MKTDFYKEMVGRNIGVLSHEEQERLRNTCIAVAGCGGMGGWAAEQLVRLGVGHIKIADPDKFAVHNLSRQCGSNSSTIGQNKAEVLGRFFKQINPELRLDIFKEGVLPKNADNFLEGAEAVIEATDFTNVEASVTIYDIAQKNNLCVVSSNAIGFGVNVFVFGPKTISMRRYLGLSSGGDLRLALLKLVPYIPSYADQAIFQKVALGEMYIPNIAMPQYLGTSIASSEAVMIVLGRVNPPAGPNPRIFIVDLQDRKFKVTG